MEISLREIAPEWKRHILWSNLQYPLWAILGFWAAFALQYFLGFDIIRFLKPRAGREPVGTTFYLAAAVVVTLGSLVFAGQRIWRAMKLASKGMFVEAHFASTGGFAYKGYVRVNFGYEVNGKSYLYAKSCIDVDADAYETGARRMILVCDPDKPKRRLEVDAFFPAEVRRRLLGKIVPGQRLNA